MNGPCFGLPPYEPEDQVVRLERFREEHPDIELELTGEIPRLREWVARRDGKILAKRYELEWMLDDLEKLLQS
jgi:hypothetical protein